MFFLFVIVLIIDALIQLFFINIESAGNCLNYTDLKSTDVTATFGTYQLPYIYNGLVDNGYLNQSSRHTVHLDTSERDLRTNNVLRTIPPNEEASVRLGELGYWLPS